MGKVVGQLIVGGKRKDGRGFLDMRSPFIVKAGTVQRADGSAYVGIGKTRSIASVYGPQLLHPKHLQEPDRAAMKVRYEMAPFSTTERKRPGPDRRSIEISKVIREALAPVLFLEEFPKAGIELMMEVIQADAGTRVTAINAASVALADAGVPMRDLVSAIAVGRVEGNLVVDLSGEEEAAADAVDMPIAMRAATGEITLLQMDGDASLDEVKKLLELARAACMTIYQAQKAALKERYKVPAEEAEAVAEAAPTEIMEEPAKTAQEGEAGKEGE